jgi:transforming growth factor-beta-induced protein
MRRAVIIITILLLVAVLSTSLVSAQRFRPGSATIAEIAVSSGNFNTLVTALVCTDLVGAVSNPSAELTVFAPTDAAFASLGLNAGNICAAFDQQTLTTILLYHVVGERRPSPSVINGRNKSITMLAGGSIRPQGQGSLVLFDNLNRATNIIAADVMARNGIIHVVDNVLLPVAP